MPDLNSEISPTFVIMYQEPLEVGLKNKDGYCTYLNNFFDWVEIRYCSSVFKVCKNIFFFDKFIRLFICDIFIYSAVKYLLRLVS